MPRPSRHERGYDTRWEKLRQAKKAANPLCEMCLNRGITKAMDDVDHIIPFNGKDDPKRLEWVNLMSLCRRCHNDKTHRRSQGCAKDGTPLDADHWWNG